MPTIRRLLPDDADAYVALRAEMIIVDPFSFIGTPGDDRGSDVNLVRQNLESPEYAYFAALDNQPGARLLSVAVVYREPRLKMRHRANIISVYTTRAARGRGLARAVVSACIEHARTWPGIEVIALSTSARAIAAQHLYASLGFVAWGTQPDSMRVNGEPDDEIHLQLTL